MLTAKFHKNTLRRYPDGCYGDYSIYKEGVLYGEISEYCAWVTKTIKKINQGLVLENTLKSDLTKYENQ
jgi:hypothetical protein